MDSAAVAQAALEKRRQEEQEKIAQERQQLIQQMTDTVAAQSAIFEEFKTNCESRLDNNTNRIAAVSHSYRADFRSRATLRPEPLEATFYEVRGAFQSELLN